MEPVQIVWFERDLRTADHQPLLQACHQGPVLPLVVVETELWQQPDASARQWAFCAESLPEQREALAQLGQPLVVRVGALEDVLERARELFGVAALWSHEGTGNGWTYARDLRVASWARSQGIPWIQLHQTGVSHALRSSDGWADQWEKSVWPHRSPQPLKPCGPWQASIPAGSPPPLSSAWRRIPSRSDNAGTAAGGGRAGEFSGWPGGPLPTGALKSAHCIQELCACRPTWPGEHWHCHFIQKLASEPDLEFRELHPAYCRSAPKPSRSAGSTSACGQC